MDRILDGVARFQSQVFPTQRPLYERLARQGQNPKTLVISCSDSRVVPELITQSDPGEMFVTRNAGNIVPPFSDVVGGVTSAIEYAVVALGVEDIVICGHSDCGAMKALLHPEMLDEMPSVKSWLGHCRCAQSVFRHAHDGTLSDKEAVKVLAMENVFSQLNNLRTHPCVAARVATGTLTLHGWFFDLESGSLLAVDGETGRFSKVEEEAELPVALPGERRVVSQPTLIAAE